MSGHDVIDLNQLGLDVMNANDKLRLVSRRFHGYEEDGERFPGIKVVYEEAIDEALNAIVLSYEEEGKRPPAEDIRAARARMRVKRENPDLHDDYFILGATIKRIERWLQNARSATMARQSVLKTERELAGKPGGYV